MCTSHALLSLLSYLTTCPKAAAVNVDSPRVMPMVLSIRSPAYMILRKKQIGTGIARSQVDRFMIVYLNHYQIVHKAEADHGNSIGYCKYPQLSSCWRLKIHGLCVNQVPPI
jgi:hypothetical protein